MLDFWTLSLRENTENKLRVYVLLWEIARECSHPQVCARVHSNRNGLTGENTLAFAIGVYYNVVFIPKNGSERVQKCPLHIQHAPTKVPYNFFEMKTP